MKNFKQKLFILGIVSILAIGVVGCSTPQKKQEAEVTNVEEEKTIYDLNGFQGYEEIYGDAIVDIKKSMAQDDDVFVKQMFNTLAEVIELLPESAKTLQLSVYASNTNADDDFLIFSCTIPQEGLENIRKDNLTSIEGLSKNCEQLYIDESVSEEAVKDVIWPGAEGSIIYVEPEEEVEVEKEHEDHQHQNTQSQGTNSNQNTSSNQNTNSNQGYCDMCPNFGTMYNLIGFNLCLSCYNEYNVRCADCGTSLAFTDFAIKAPNGTWYCVFCGENRGYSYDM